MRIPLGLHLSVARSPLRIVQSQGSPKPSECEQHCSLAPASPAVIYGTWAGQLAACRGPVAVVDPEALRALRRGKALQPGPCQDQQRKEDLVLPLAHSARRQKAPARAVKPRTPPSAFAAPQARQSPDQPHPMGVTAQGAPVDVHVLACLAATACLAFHQPAKLAAIRGCCVPVQLAPPITRADQQADVMLLASHGHSKLNFLALPHLNPQSLLSGKSCCEGRQPNRGQHPTPAVAPQTCQTGPDSPCEALVQAAALRPPTPPVATVLVFLHLPATGPAPL